MGGLQRFFLRITPIIMLICFICLGITHTFSKQTDQQPITYLTNQTYIVQEDNPETEEIDESITIDNYEFDFKSYRENISTELLKKATENVIDLTTFSTILGNFKLLWEDGYQPLDISKSILNAVILIIDSLLVAINIFILPIRIATAVLLTGMSLIGININRTEGIIIPFLNGIVKYANIKLIGRTDNNENGQYENLSNTTWTFNDNISIPDNTFIVIKEGLHFTSNNENYNQIIISRGKNTTGLLNRQYTTTIIYGNDVTNNQVYTEGNWTNNNYKTIYINTVTNQDSNSTLYIWLNNLATQQQVTPTNPNYENTYEWNDIKLNTYRPNNLEQIWFNTTFISNNENYGRMIIGADNTEIVIIYYDMYGNGNLIFRSATGFSNLAYEKFELTQPANFDPVQQNIYNILINQNWITQVT